MTKTLKLLATTALIGITSSTAYAQGFLDRMNDVINKVDETMTTGEKAQNSAERVMDKIPESADKEEEPKPEQTAKTEAAPSAAPQETPEDIEPAASDETGLTKEQEDEILRRAREIEERRILEEAERIKKERGIE